RRARPLLAGLSLLALHPEPSSQLALLVGWQRLVLLEFFHLRLRPAIDPRAVARGAVIQGHRGSVVPAVALHRLAADRTGGRQAAIGNIALGDNDLLQVIGHIQAGLHVLGVEPDAAATVGAPIDADR